MGFVSKSALAAVLALGAAALTAAPAEAQKKKKEEAPKVQINDAFRAAAVAGETAAKAGDIATAKARLAEADAAATSDIEKFYAANLRLQVAQASKDNALLATAIDQMIANPNTPAEQQATLNYNRGILALNAKDKAGARQYFQRAKQLGYNDPEYDLRMASLELEGGNVDQGVSALDKAIQAKVAAGQPVPNDWYNLAISQLYKANKPAETAAWMRRQLKDYPTATNWRKALILFRDRADQGRALGGSARLDTFRLMRETGALTDQAEFGEYAQLAQDLGLPYETVAVIDQGRAAGKIPASATQYNALKTEAQAGIRAEGSLSSLDAKSRSAANGKLAAGTANAYLANGDAAKAAEFFQLALQKGGVDQDEVNTRLGIALAKSGRRDEAKAAFAKVTGAPRNELAAFWTLWLDSPKTAG
nr:tetratricopeptide repeat protein [uncultured Sphingomonas sp.]